jgi:hypothetical protein
MRMNLREHSIEEMEAEIERRRRKEELESRPKLRESPDFSKLITECSSVLDQIAEDHYMDEDSKEYIYEAAMAAIFGPDVWKWINARLS